MYLSNLKKEAQFSNILQNSVVLGLRT